MSGVTGVWADDIEVAVSDFILQRLVSNRMLPEPDGYTMG